MARTARSRAGRAAPGGACRDRDAGDVRRRRGGDRQPGAGDVRRAGVVRDAAAGRLPRHAAGAAAGAGGARARGMRVRVRGHAGLAERLARGRGDGGRRLRRAVRRRRQLRAGGCLHLAAAGFHPAGDDRRAAVVGGRSGGGLGHGRRGRATGRGTTVAATRARAAALRGHDRLPGAGGAVARGGRVRPERP